jgi:Protein of unknown function (DUF3800)
MQVFYVDDSGDNEVSIFSAVSIPAGKWHEAFDMLLAHRRALRATDGIRVRKELHAWKFVSGRGNVSDRIVPKGRRCQIFRDTLEVATTLPGIGIFNVIGPASQEVRCFERLLNRVNRTVLEWQTGALVICDQGKDHTYTRLRRKMGRHNPIPSRFGAWPSGATTKNIPLDRIVEDLVFRQSDQSLFIQLADFCAYALLRKEQPLASKSKYGLDAAFEILSPVLVRECAPRDRFGVIRVV